MSRTRLTTDTISKQSTRLTTTPRAAATGTTPCKPDYPHSPANQDAHCNEADRHPEAINKTTTGRQPHRQRSANTPTQPAPQRANNDHNKPDHPPNKSPSTPPTKTATPAQKTSTGYFHKTQPHHPPPTHQLTNMDNPMRHTKTPQ
jgi:hypothetical protein